MSLHEKAVLVTLSLSRFGLNRREDEEARAVARRHAADSASVSVVKRILHGAAGYDAIRKFDGQLGEWNRRHSLPWSDAGTRLLPTLGYADYMERVRQSRAEREGLVRTFLDSYDAQIQADRARLGTMFRASDYPDRCTVRERFAFRLDVTPVPDGKDFRISVSREEMLAMTAGVDERIRAAEEKARLDLFHRLAGPLSDMAEKLGSGRDLTLQTTNPLIENLTAILDLIPRLNITGDPKIEEFRRLALEKLASITPTTLRDNDLVRAVAANRAQEILDRMADFMGGPPPALAEAA